MPETITLNAGAASELELIDTAAGYGVLEHAYPAPAPEPVYASSADTEGEILVGLRYRNRTLNLTVECDGEDKLQQLQAVLGHIGREGGTYTWESPAGNVVTFDLLTWNSYEPDFDIAFDITGVAQIKLELPAKPFGRGTPITLAAVDETTYPVLVFTEDDIPGDVPALAELELTELDGDDQRWIIWGQQQRNYSADASAAYFIPAADLTAQGGAAKTAGSTGATGGGNNVIRAASLDTSYTSLVSGQLSASSTYLSHVGTFRVFARVLVSNGAAPVDLALEWAEGDFGRFTRESPQTLPTTWINTWRIVELGTVTISRVDEGVQRWEPRIIGRCSSSIVPVEINWLFLMPTDEGSGEVQANYQLATPSSFVLNDGFDQSAGNLNGKTLTSGQAWATSGGATDLAVSGGSTVTRTTTSDAQSRTAVAGTTDYAAVAARIDLAVSTIPTTGTTEQSIIVRRVDANNFFILRLRSVNDSAGTAYLDVRKVVGGIATTLGLFQRTIAAGTGYRLQLVVYASGRWEAYFSTQAGVPTMVLSGNDDVLATGGALDDGKVAFSDYHGGSGGQTRTYDNFRAWVPVADAALFANRKLRIHSDRVRRDDAGGTLSVKPSIYEGRYITVQPTGPEGRTTAIVVKASRHVPGQGSDTGTDDLRGQLTVTPRYHVIGG